LDPFESTPKWKTSSLHWTPLDNSLKPSLIQTYIYYFLLCLLHAHVVEWRLSSHQLISKHSNAPQIHCFIVILSLENLWCNVVACPAVCFAPLLITECGPAKIRQFAYILNYRKLTFVMMIF
jgi:hypothetical protein